MLSVELDPRQLATVCGGGGVLQDHVGEFSWLETDPVLIPETAFLKCADGAIDRWKAGIAGLKYLGGAFVMREDLKSGVPTANAKLRAELARCAAAPSLATSR